MVFSSVLFLFFFLPFALLFCFSTWNRWRNGSVLALSIFFYAWGEKEYTLLLGFSTMVNFFIAQKIEAPLEKCTACQPELLRKRLLTAGIVFNLLVLLFFKYAGFLVDNWNVVGKWIGMEPVFIPPLHAPVGISFFTFSAISCLVDIYRFQAKAPNPGELSLYLFFFPKIMAGPILPFRNAHEQLTDRSSQVGGFLQGIERFITGLGKKILIANPLAAAADRIFAIPIDGLTLETAWLGILCYSLQIYFDFSGYTDMAIGLGKMFGFNLPENFNYPYVSQSVQEFWRRWHISLSSWLRDYLYIPLGGSRCGPGRQYFNIIVVFLLCGLWHGASWNFVLWGLWYGFFLTLERAGLATVLHSAWRPLRHVYLLLVVIVGWVLFRSETIAYALGYVQAMIGVGQGDGLEYPLSLFVDRELILWIFIGILMCMPFASRLRHILMPEPSCDGSRAGALSLGLSSLYVLSLGLLFLLACMSMAGGTHKAFIYFKF